MIKPKAEPINYGSDVPSRFFNISWRTNEGKKIRVKDMTEDHVRNTIKYLQRREPLKDVEIMVGWGGDLDDFDFDFALPTINDRELIEWIDIFQAELKRRNLPLELDT